MEVSAGQLLGGKYRIERVLGQGGMGVVVAAHHLVLDEAVAIKFLLPEALGSAEAVARFEREARAAVKIKSEHVARVSDVGTLDSGAPYMVMELLRGCDLADLLRQAGPLPIEDVADYVLQAGEAIGEAHGLGIVHRDLKPQNLFLTQRADGSSCVKVLDFGISKMAPSGPNAQAMTSTLTILGSPLYMSPEQLMSARDVDMTTDIWALGVICFELLSGRTPFIADTLPQLCIAITASAPIPLRSLRPDVPVALAALIERCLEKDRTKRVATVAELARELVEFAPARSRLSAERIERLAVAVGHSTGARAVPPRIDTPASALSSATLVVNGPVNVPTVASFGQTKQSASARSRRVPLAVLVLAGVAAVGVWFWRQRSPSAAGERVAASLAQTAQTAQTTAALASAPVEHAAPALTTSDGAVAARPERAPTPSALPVRAVNVAPAARAVAHPTVRTPALAPASRAAVDCDIPYTFDARGNKIFKKGCL